jgi:uncharacterized YigZ family protein
MTAPEPYHTVAGPGEAAFTVQGSEFLGYVRPVDSVADAEAFLDGLREEYADATHVVPAYRVRADPLRAYASDDGEPNSSAGKPALNVLQGEDLENVVAGVVRYYGGTNLGVGGLVSAYGRAVSAAVADAGTVTERPHEWFVATVAYDDSGTVRSILEGTDCDFSADYEAEVTFEVRVPVETGPDLRDRLRSATSGRVDVD